jgi:hypothetical protein
LATGPAATAAPALPGPPPAARALMAACLACSGSIFCRNDSFCDAITLPLIFSLPVVKSFIGSDLPVVMSMKSASLISRVQSAAPWPSVTEPLPVFRSITHAESGLVTLNR